MTKAFDLSDLKPKTDTLKVDLVHPATEEPLGMFIEAYLPHTAEYKEVFYEETDKQIKRMAKTGKKDSGMTAKQLEETSVHTLAKITKSWNLTEDGKKLPLTYDNANKVYYEFPWLKLQVEEALNDNANFLKD